jgi:hypothetical protein
MTLDTQHFIWTIEDAASSEFCKKLCAFIDKYESHMEDTDYGLGETRRPAK